MLNVKRYGDHCGVDGQLWTVAALLLLGKKTQISFDSREMETLKDDCADEGQRWVLQRRTWFFRELKTTPPVAELFSLCYGGAGSCGVIFALPLLNGGGGGGSGFLRSTSPATLLEPPRMRWALPPVDFRSFTFPPPSFAARKTHAAKLIFRRIFKKERLSCELQLRRSICVESCTQFKPKRMTV